MKTSPERTEIRITEIAPQFLVDDLERAVAYYRDNLEHRVMMRCSALGYAGPGTAADVFEAHMYGNHVLVTGTRCRGRRSRA